MQNSIDCKLFDIVCFIGLTLLQRMQNIHLGAPTKASRRPDITSVCVTHNTQHASGRCHTSSSSTSRCLSACKTQYEIRIWAILQRLILPQCLHKAIQNMHLGDPAKALPILPQCMQESLQDTMQSMHLGNRTEAIPWHGIASMRVNPNTKHSSGRSHRSNSLT